MYLCGCSCSLQVFAKTGHPPFCKFYNLFCKPFKTLVKTLQEKISILYTAFVKTPELRLPRAEPHPAARARPSQFSPEDILRAWGLRISDSELLNERNGFLASELSDGDGACQLLALPVWAL